MAIPCDLNVFDCGIQIFAHCHAGGTITRHRVLTTAMNRFSLAFRPDAQGTGP